MSTLILQNLSQQHWTADGSQTVWNFTFSGGYISRDHVKAYYIPDTEGALRVPVVITEDMFLGDFQLNVTPAIPAGYEFVIYRDTPKTDALVDFSDGGRIDEASLDIMAKQGVFCAAEAADFFGVTTEADLIDLAQSASSFADAAAASAANALASETDAEAAALAAANSATAAATSASASALSASNSAASASSFLTQLAAHIANLASSVGATLVGYIQSGVGAVQRTLASKLAEQVSVLDFIPVAYHAAIRAGTNTVDLTDYFNAAIAAARVVLVPAGSYRVHRPINMGARRTINAAYWGRSLVGEGRHATAIDGYTGVYPVIDVTGVSGVKIKGIAIRSDNPPAGLGASDCASVGILFSRGTIDALANGCNQCRLEDVKMNMTSDMTRNGGYGTIGFVNHAAEHTSGDNVDITANLPLIHHNTLGITMARSSDIPTYGVQYEVGQLTAGASTRIHEWSNMILVAYDSFRLLWLSQAGEFSMQTAYGSTRKLVSSVPAYTESAYIWDCQSISIDMFQEVSGKFGGTWVQDHAFLKFGGICTDLKIKMERTAFDMGFTMPGAASSSILLENASYLGNFDINCHYNYGDYQTSADTLGLASEAIAMVSGAVGGVRYGKFVLDSITSRNGSGNVFNPISGWENYSVDSINFLSGASYWGNSGGTFSPAIFGSTSAGSGGYTIRAGYYQRIGRVVHFSINLGWNSHIGTGNMGVNGLPFTAKTMTGDQVAILSHSTLAATSGRTVVLRINNGTTEGTFLQLDSSGGGYSAIPVDGTVANMDITGTYMIA